MVANVSAIHGEQCGEEEYPAREKYTQSVSIADFVINIHPFTEHYFISYGLFTQCIITLILLNCIMVPVLIHLEIPTMSSQHHPSEPFRRYGDPLMQCVEYLWKL